MRSGSIAMKGCSTYLLMGFTITIKSRRPDLLACVVAIGRVVESSIPNLLVSRSVTTKNGGSDLVVARLSEGRNAK